MIEILKKRFERNKLCHPDVPCAAFGSARLAGFGVRLP